MNTSTLPRLAEQSVAARGGAHLDRLALDASIAELDSTRNTDGTVTITGVDLLKVGLFNGYIEVIEADLLGMAERFVQLRDAGIFLPPFRLDHSWSVLSVIGYFEEIDTYSRVDETDGVSKLFLRGSIRITGSLDYEPAKILAAIKRGALRTRSSEFGYYVTNDGRELPSVYYGCAFVDIPAVEGLAPVELSRSELHRPEPASIRNLSANAGGAPHQEGASRMDPKKLARLAELRTLSSTTGGLTQDDRDELARLEQDAQASGTTDDDVAAADPNPEAGGTDAADADQYGDGQGDGTDVDGSTPPAADDPDQDPTPGPDANIDPPTDPQAQPGGVTDAGPDEVGQLRAQLAAIRQERADEQIAQLTAAGVIVDTNRDAATALLSHESDEVRRAAGTILGGFTSRVELGRRRGSTSLAATGGGRDNGNGGGGLIVLGMEPDEVDEIWSGLTSEERKLRQSEYDAWRRDRQRNR